MTFRHTLGITLLAAMLAAPAQAASLFRYVPAAKDAKATDMLVAPTAVLFDREALAALQPGETLEAQLPDGRAVMVLIEKLEVHGNGDVSWSGTVLGQDREDRAARGTTGGTGTFAEIETSAGTWGVIPSQSGHDWIFDKAAAEANAVAPRTDDFILAPQDFAIGPKATCPTVGNMPTPQVTIDVMAVITPDFVSTHGGAAGAETRLNYIFSSMNAYNAASNIAITFRRVATVNVNYPSASATDDDVALNAITSGAAPFGSIKAVRNFFGADMVAMFRGPTGSGNSISGVAWLTGDRNGNMPASHAEQMFSVSGDWRFPSATLPAHELGHNLGNAHDRPNAQGGGGSTTYSHGHFVCGSGASSNCGQAGFNNTGTGFGTIMAYHQPTVAKFSSPGLTCKGTQSGAITAPCGVPDQQDDVRGTNCVRQTVANFRPSWVETCANLKADADNDGIPDCVEAGSGKSNGARDNDVFNSSLLFAAQQFRDFLSREGDADGLHYWTGALSSGANSRTQMVQGFLDSAEFQGSIAPVARLYFAYFLRIPDYAGLQHWIGQYKSGVSLAAISQQFAASPEFAGRYGTLSNAQFVTLVYTNVLGRAPDAAGLAHWNGQLATGVSRGSVMLSFSESAEYRAVVHNEIYVTMTYMGMLRRSPDGSGFDYWTGQLDAGNSAAALIGGFLGSPEYRARFLS